MGNALPRHLREVVAHALPDHPEAERLVLDFLLQDGVDPGFAMRLIRIGRGIHGEPWTIRLLAARMLERQILAIDAGDIAAHTAIFDSLGVGFEPREGFAANRAEDRVAQFRARLARFASAYRTIDGVDTTPAALERLIRSSRRPCLVPIARYLFAHDEVLDRVYELTRQSRGLRDPDCESPLAARQALDAIPRRDAELAAALSDTHEIFWVDRQTPSEINSLVEYPLGTVALVIKPPGTDVEIEIKRAGLRGPRALDVVYERNGYVVCSTHHLQGASPSYQLEWQTRAEGRFAAIWRAVHGEEAPISRTLRVNSVFKMPLDDGRSASVIRYFADPELYGDGYEHMRGELARALDSLRKADGEPPYEAPNEMALTGRFFGAVKPSQAVQVGTTSFRVDRVARYFRPDGALSYHEELGVPCHRDDELSFADELLSEVLTVFEPPARQHRTYAGYLKAAFAIPRNRARADRNFIDCAKQLGVMFGTCVGLCIGSHGESFVARNVGLRSVFERGGWRLKLLFIDHDALSIAEAEDQEIYPQWFARRIRDDYEHILGAQTDTIRVPGTLNLLADIYRVSRALRRAGVAAFHTASGNAFRVTRRALPRRLTKLFHPRWIARMEDFDRAVRTLVRAGEATPEWCESIESLLAKRAPVTRVLLRQYIQGVGGFCHLWCNLPYMHETKGTRP